jgi:hypothetical protein
MDAVLTVKHREHDGQVRGYRRLASIFANPRVVLFEEPHLRPGSEIIGFVAPDAGATAERRHDPCDLAEVLEKKRLRLLTSKHPELIRVETNKLRDGR